MGRGICDRAILPLGAYNQRSSAPATMSMPYRARRALQFDHGDTPSVVGPGAYLGHARYLIPPNFTGFSTSFDRHREPVFTSTAHHPGPGHYGEETSAVHSKAYQSAAFASKSKRFASSQTGTPGPKYTLRKKSEWKTTKMVRQN